MILFIIAFSIVNCGCFFRDEVAVLACGGCGGFNYGRFKGLRFLKEDVYIQRLISIRAFFFIILVLVFILILSFSSYYIYTFLC
ncbi:hypothetical protein HanPSC8_Chr13g0568311 [Helianthus annuus]|nr:hypothetical protein HanPSC8_Chr13g0568311 [Helianthus annuus]